MIDKQEIHPHRVTQVVEKCSRCEKILEQQEQRRAWWKRFSVFSFAVTVSSTLMILVIYKVSEQRISSPKPEPQRVEKRTTKCYFVRQNKYEADDHRVRPWEPWHVWESQGEGRANYAATGDVFASKAEAWSFIQKWKLEPCR